MFETGKRYFNTLAVYAYLGLDTDRLSQIPMQEIKDTHVTHIGTKSLRIYAAAIYPKIRRNYILLIAQGGGIFNVTALMDRTLRDFPNQIVIVADVIKDDKRYVILRKKGLLKYIIPEEDGEPEEPMSIEEDKE